MAKLLFQVSTGILRIAQNLEQNTSLNGSIFCKTILIAEAGSHLRVIPCLLFVLIWSRLRKPTGFNLKIEDWEATLLFKQPVDEYARALLSSHTPDHAGLRLRLTHKQGKFM